MKPPKSAHLHCICKLERSAVVDRGHDELPALRVELHEHVAKDDRAENGARLAVIEHA